MPTLLSRSNLRARLALPPPLKHSSHTQQEAMAAYEAGPLVFCRGRLTLKPSLD